MDKKISIIIGTRPEAIKLAPLAKSLNDFGGFRTTLINTGQHSNLLEGLLDYWDLKFDFEFKIAPGEGNRFLLPTLLNNLNMLLQEIETDLVIVQGDTASALSGAMVAYSLNLPIAHIEAGLRSGDLSNPNPEEGYRRAIDTISNLHFAPSAKALSNLEFEGHAESSYNVGNTVVDSLLHIQKLLNEDEKFKEIAKNELPNSLPKNYIVFTQHRREGFGEGQSRVFKAISELAKVGHPVIFPVHPNPKVASLADSYFSGLRNVYMIKPLSYISMVRLWTICWLYC